MLVQNVCNASLQKVNRKVFGISSIVIALQLRFFVFEVLKVQGTFNNVCLYLHFFV